MLFRSVTLPADRQQVFFLEANSESPWTPTTTVKRYYVSLPCYPFRTLTPREQFMMGLKSHGYNDSSPLIPAHTKINIVLTRRKKKNLLNYMLPTTMNFKPGSQSSTLAGDVRDGFLTFKISTGAGENAAQVDVVISKVEIKIKHMFLQVCHNCCVCVGRKGGERVWASVSIYSPDLWHALPRLPIQLQ